MFLFSDLTETAKSFRTAAGKRPISEDMDSNVSGKPFEKPWMGRPSLRKSRRTGSRVEPHAKQKQSDEILDRAFTKGNLVAIPARIREFSANRVTPKLPEYREWSVQSLQKPVMSHILILGNEQLLVKTNVVSHQSPEFGPFAQGSRKSRAGAARSFPSISPILLFFPQSGMPISGISAGSGPLGPFWRIQAFDTIHVPHPKTECFHHLVALILNHARRSGQVIESCPSLHSALARVSHGEHILLN